MSGKKEIKALIEEAEAAGAEYCGLTKNGHHKMVYGGKPIFFASTPSCYRSVGNTRALMRRVGIPLER